MLGGGIFLFEKYKLECIILISVITVIFLMSTALVFVISDKVLFYIPITGIFQKTLGIFRVPGRFIHGNYYILYCILFAFLLKTVETKKVLIILFCALSIQIYDIHENLLWRQSCFSEKKYFINELNNNRLWNSLAKNKKNIIIFSFMPDYYTHFYDFAIRNNFKVNNLQLSRNVNPKKFYDFLLKRYQTPSKYDLYVFHKDDLGFIKEETNLKYCYYITPEYITCTKFQDKGFKEINLQSYIKYDKTTEAYKLLYKTLKDNT